MNRRHFSLISLWNLARFAALGQSPASSEAPPDLLFPTGLPLAEWKQFPAHGFRNRACGILYGRERRPRNGMPLGAIDTGRIDLQLDGTIGFCTAYNSLCPQRGPLDLPFIGLTAGKQVWILSQPPGTFGEYMFNGLQIPSDIRYWGHFPIADLEFVMSGSPVSVGLRAWAPFLPGDSATSNTPGAVFDLHLRNRTNSPQSGRIALTFPGPTQAEAQVSSHSPREKIPFLPYGHSWVPVASEKTNSVRETVRGEFSGLVVRSEKVRSIGYAIGVAGDVEVMTGGGLHYPDSPYKTGQTWSRIGSTLPPAREQDFSGSISVPYELKAGEHKVMRFVLAWFAPMWIGEGDHTFTHMYATRYKDALEAARFLSREHDSLLRRILGWQDVIFGEERMPIWLRESLVNILYLLPVNSLWAAARPPIGPWCRAEDGLFGLLDGIVEDPAMEPIPDTFYANAPLVYFFPDLALSTLRGYKAYQFASGAAVWIWGGVVGAAIGGYEMTAGTELAMPTPGYQTTTNGPCYVDIVDRYLLRTGSAEALQELYPSVKASTKYTMSLRREDGADGIVSVPSGNVDPQNPAGQPGHHLEWFENVLWFGMTPHVGGIHLANLKMAGRMAMQAGDVEFARQCRIWFDQGSASLEKKLWAGEYYLAYNDPKAGKKSDDVFAYQLDGEWMARFHGLNNVFPPARLKTALSAIRRACAEKWPAGAVNLARPNGDLAEGVGYGPNAYFVPELYMLAMTYIYAGDRDFGLELARRCVHSLNIGNLLTWNQPNVLRADTGDMLFGSHYVQNMMLWALPAALEGKDIGAFCASGGLVDRMIRAAKAGLNPVMRSLPAIRFAVIGCGGAAWIGHLPWIGENPNAGLIAVCDVDVNRAREAGERYDAEALTSYREVLERDDIDAVVIATPPASHCEIACAAANAGKHILLEKPMARTVAECDLIANAAARKHIVLMLGHEKRFSIASEKIRELVDHGLLGKLFYLVVHWGASVKLCPERLIPPGYRESYEWRWRDRSLGGGILQDHLPHYVDLWRWWTGSEVESVCAEVQNIARDYLDRPDIAEWEDFGTVLMRFSDGAVAVFNTGTAGRGLSPILHLGSGIGEWSEFGYLFGTRGQLAFDFFPWDSPEHGRLMINSLERDSDTGFGWSQVELPEPRRAPGGPRSPVTNQTFMFRRQMDHFIRCIQTGAQPAVGAVDGRATLAVVEAVYESQRSGQKVYLPKPARSCHGDSLSDSIA